MKKQLLARILSFTLAFIILSSDISVYAASMTPVEDAEIQTEDSDEEVPAEEPTEDEAVQQVPENSQEETLPIENLPVENEPTEEPPVDDEEPVAPEPEEEPEIYEPYWEQADFSNLILFVDFQDTERENFYDAETLKAFYGDEEDPEGMRWEIFQTTEEQLKIETILPQYDPENEQVIPLVFENEASAYKEKDTALIEEAAELLKDSGLLKEGMVLDHLTIVIPNVIAEDEVLFTAHVGKYDGEATVGDQKIDSYSILAEEMLYEENAWELLSQNLLEALIAEGLIEAPEEEPEEEAEKLPAPMEELPKGICRVGRNYYLYDDNGKLMKGYVKYAEKNYYCDQNGILQSGWIKIGSDWKYFDEKAEFAEIKVQTTDQLLYNLENGNVSYFTNKTTLLKNSWLNYGGQRYYFDEKGMAVQGWYQEGNNTYYAELAENATDKSPAGSMAKGVKKIDGQIYGFHGSQYYCLSGWQTIDGKRYYFREDYSAVTGWYQEGTAWYYAEEDGTMVKGAKTIDRKIYGFHPTQYYRLSGWQTLGGKRYYFDENFVAVTGWYRRGDYWYYANPEGVMQIGLTSIGEKNYYFDSNYRLSTGWKHIAQEMHYFDHVAENPEKCCELKVVAKEQLGNWVTIVGETEEIRKSYLKTNYQVLKGWQTIGGKRFYFDSTGILETGWFQVGRYYYYAEPKEVLENGVPVILQGTLAAGTKEIDGKIYGFHTTQYYRLTGWQTLRGNRYFFREDCTAVKGWYREGNYWYYADENGVMAKGEKTIRVGEENRLFYFDNNYRLVNGWIKVGTEWKYFDIQSDHEQCFEIKRASENGSWIILANGERAYLHSKKGILKNWQTIEGQRYYFGAEGILRTGEFKVGTNTYYAEPEVGRGETQLIPVGALAKGIKTIAGETYVFHTGRYHRLTGWQTVNGKRYYLGTDGKMLTDCWYQEGDYWYHADQEGAMAKGRTLIGEKYYYFDKNYRLSTGWKRIDQKMHFFDQTAENPEECYELAAVAKEQLGNWITLEKENCKTRKSYVQTNYQVLTGWQTISGVRYYFGKIGVMETGWFQINGYWYYAKENGTVVNGTQKIRVGDELKTYYFDENYRLQTGWQIIEGKNCYVEVTDSPENYQVTVVGNVAAGWFMVNGKTFYGDNYGKVKTGWQTIEKKRYYFDANGILQKNWILLNGKTYYADPQTGIMAKGIQNIENETYVFHTSQYYMLTGFQSNSGKRYYLQPNGTAKTGWFTIGVKCYYGNTDGTLAVGVQEIDGQTYFFHISQNYRLTGWQTVNGNRYYLQSDGTAKTGWFTVSGKIYYAESATEEMLLKGTLAKGAKKIDGKIYGFHANQYYRLTGWQTMNGKRYYLNADGMAKTGWFTVSGKHYYADVQTGIVQKGLQELPFGQEMETKIYYFDGNYRLKTGWQTINGKKYFFNFSETPAECYASYIGSGTYGWQTMDDGNIYYADSRGNIKTGWQTIGGQRYYFEKTGALQTNWFTISNKRYYAEPKAEDGKEQSIPAGAVAKGAKNIGGATYFFHLTGYYRLTGWQTEGDRRYYIQSTGTAKTGWFKQGSYWYYGTENVENGETTECLNGAMEKGIRTIRIAEGENFVERTYFFDTNYRLASGWKVLNGTAYFFRTADDPKECYLLVSCAAPKGWYTFEDGTRSYFDAKGNPVTGWQTIEGNRYYFDATGIMQTGWTTINGVSCYFDRNGRYIPITKPTLTSVTSTVYKTADIKWNRIEGVQKYCLEYSRSPIFPSWEVTTLEYGAEETSCRIEDLEINTIYYLRLSYTVWSSDDEEQVLYESDYSPVKSVKICAGAEPTANAAVISECQIISGSRENGITVQLKAALDNRIKSADEYYYIVETESYGTAIDLAEPVGAVEKSFDVDTTLQIDAGLGDNSARQAVNRALMNKFALAVKKENGTYQVISTPMGITNPEAISENKADILKPVSKKGLQGVGYDAAQDTNSKNTLFNLDLATVVGTGPASGYEPYEYKGKTYYFSDCSNLVGEFRNLEEGILQYTKGITGEKSKVCVTLNLLLSYRSSNAYLIDPAARSSGHRYYTLNMREERARETYEALFFYLGELFGKSDCYVTHWVLGNEVNSSRAWNYQGSLSFQAYMQSYAAAFRLLYNGVKASKSGNNVYISLDNGWTAAPDTYAGKSTLDNFAAYAQKENPKMKWSIAYHAYSYPLTRVDFWNDNSNTTFSTSTRYISMKNISVLTDYAAMLEQKYEKPNGSVRVIFSEQGYTAGGKTDTNAEAQARALARGYYMAEFNDRVDAFIIRATNDDTEEMKGGLYLGLKTYNDIKRITFYTYEFMDSDIDYFATVDPGEIAWSPTNQNKVRKAQEILGRTGWESIIPNFNKNKLAGMP